jgi:hypothetical protein
MAEDFEVVCVVAARFAVASADQGNLVVDFEFDCLTARSAFSASVIGAPSGC